jgi:hypothetical protein
MTLCNIGNGCRLRKGDSVLVFPLQCDGHFAVVSHKSRLVSAIQHADQPPIAPPRHIVEPSRPAATFVAESTRTQLDCARDMSVCAHTSTLRKCTNATTTFICSDCMDDSREIFRPKLLPLCSKARDRELRRHAQQSIMISPNEVCSDPAH